eukprot:m.229405 g.229405  ORF g.229405 m.229405 type:complete len:623 (-) comp17052_c2_seq1:206-2074(-)
MADNERPGSTSSFRKKKKFLFFRLGDELISEKPKRRLPFRLLRRASGSSSDPQSPPSETQSTSSSISDPVSPSSALDSSTSFPPIIEEPEVASHQRTLDAAPESEDRMPSPPSRPPAAELSRDLSISAALSQTKPMTKKPLQRAYPRSIHSSKKQVPRSITEEDVKAVFTSGYLTVRRNPTSMKAGNQLQRASSLTDILSASTTSATSPTNTTTSTATAATMAVKTPTEETAPPTPVSRDDVFTPESQLEAPPVVDNSSCIEDDTPLDPSTEERRTAALWFRHSWAGRSLSDREEEEDIETTHSSVFRMTDLEVGAVLGTGFYGRVLQCTHKFTGETVVVKELIRSDPDAKALFVQEMSLLKKLRHPNVLRFIGLFYSNDKLNLVTEYVSNGTMRNHILNTEEELPWDLRVQMARDVADGMTYLHEQSIIHRDLKTENCLVREDMSVVVCDFGLARVMKGEVFKEPTSTPSRSSWNSMRVPSSATKMRPAQQQMTVVGTPEWMAPEVVMGREYGQAADVFSFGLILCSLIARMDPDADLIRTPKFGLDHEKFKKNYAGDSPNELLDLAFECTRMEPGARLAFAEASARLYLIDLQISSQMLTGFENVTARTDGKARRFTHAK